MSAGSSAQVLECSNIFRQHGLFPLNIPSFRWMRMLASTMGAGLAGLMEGIIVRVAPQVGAAAPVLTWGALIGTSVVGALGSLFTRGVLGDVLHGVAAGGVGALGYSLPELIAPTVGRRRTTQIQGGGQGQVQSNVKLLGARSAVEF